MRPSCTSIRKTARRVARKRPAPFEIAFSRYEKLHVTIFGVSRDSREIHAEFRESHRLPFSLVSDASGSIARAYGVSSPLGMSARVTFLVGADGRVARVWPDVDPGVHANEVLAAAEATVARALTRSAAWTTAAFARFAQARC